MVFGIWAIVVRFARAIRKGFAEPEFRGLLWLTVLIVGGGAVFFRVVEDWSWLDSVYFTVITLTTVGYGDLAPSTPGSRAFTIVLILLGIGILITFIERVARYATEDFSDRRRRGERS